MTTIAEETRAAHVAQLEQALRAARFVAEHWRAAFLAMEGPERIGCHPLALVLAALDGETDPRELGISPTRHDAFREALEPTGLPPEFFRT